MLLHLPIAILATLLPTAASDSVPQFDIPSECRFEGGSKANVERCSQDEAAALARLTTEWAQSQEPTRRPVWSLQRPAVS